MILLYRGFVGEGLLFRENHPPGTGDPAGPRKIGRGNIFKKEGYIIYGK